MADVHSIYQGAFWDLPAGWRCYRCGEFKPSEEWPRRGNGRRGIWCRSCTKKYNQERRRRLAGDPLEQAKLYRNHRKKWLRKYGMTVAEYESLFEAQAGSCAICGRMEKTRRKGTLLHLSVDHDHRTGRIRALLCHSCNKGLGHFEDDPEMLEQAAAYLRRYRAG